MAVVRKTISMPPALAAKLEAAARERATSVSDVVVEALEKDLDPPRPWKLPFEYLVEGPGDMSQRVDELLRETWADDIENDR